MGRTATTPSHSEEQILVCLWVGRHVSPISRHNLQREHLVDSQPKFGAQGRVAPSRDPTAVRPNGKARGRRKRNVVLLCMRKGLPSLQSGTHAGGWAAVVPSGLFVAGEELKTLQVVRPNAECPRTSVPANEIMPGIPTSQLSVNLGEWFSRGQHRLDNQSDILIPCKVDRCLDVLDASCIDNVDGVSPLSAVTGGIRREEAGIPLRPLGEDRDRIVQIEGCPARVVDEETAGLGVEVGRCAITH